MLISTLLLTLGTALGPSEGPDTVKLADGKKVLEGRVVWEGPDEIVLRVNKKDQRIPRKDIAEIRTLERSLASLIDRDFAATEPAALKGLAVECTQAGLDAEAKNLWLRVLLADPADDDALKGAGARRIVKDVKVKLGKEQRDLTELTKRQASWKEAYELDTTHFVMHSDLDLPQMLDLAIALERFYKRFYETLGAPIELYVFEGENEVPEVNLYGRAEDFPVPTVKGDIVWFAPGINRLHVLADPPPAVASVVSELSKMMLFNSLRRSSGATAQVPMWTADGIARIFAVAAPAERGGKWGELSTPDRGAFALAERGNIPLDKVFNSTRNDFNADANRGEMQASSYTLVHYLVFGAEGKLRSGFGTFLREGAKGKISMGALTKALGVQEKELESGWREHVKANANAK